MTHCFTIMVTFVINFMAYGFAWRAVSEMTGMLIIIYMSTFIFNLTREVALGWFCVPLSTARHSDIGFLAAASHFRFQWARIARAMMADCRAFVAAALEGFVTNFFTWWTVPIAALACAAMLPTWPDPLAL